MGKACYEEGTWRNEIPTFVSLQFGDAREAMLALSY
jgi:hypothetical protein